MAAKVGSNDLIQRKRSFCLLSQDDDLATTFVKAGWERKMRMRGADLVIFSGDSLVHPFMVGERVVDDDVSGYDIRKDRIEVKMFKALDPNIKKLGINRGAVLLNNLCGGNMFQKVDGHNTAVAHRIHTMLKDWERKSFFVVGRHTQAMIPHELGEVLAWANESTYRETETLKYTEAVDRRDTEVVYYWHNNTMCIQYEPTDSMPMAQEYCLHLVDNYLF